MRVELVDHTPDPEQAIAKAAAICWNSESTPEKNKLRLEAMLAKGHFSPLRFAYATFEVSGVSRIQANQQVRVAHAGFLQESQRYVPNNEIAFIYPPSFQQLSKDQQKQIAAVQATVWDTYISLVEAGIPIEDARYLLPLGTATKYTMTGNFQMWLSYLKARTSDAAQWEIRAVAQEIGRQLHLIAPTVFAQWAN